MDKSTSQKALKVVSIIMIVFAICEIVAGIVIAATGGAIFGFGEVTGDFSKEVVFAGAMMAGIIFVIVGAVEGIIGFLGLRGANNPQKIKAFFILAVIGTIIAFVSGISNTVGGAGNTLMIDLTGVVLPLIGAILAYKIKKENNL
ncbi:MAG: hypothetical protein RR655_00640 [Raoultibacter sp.]